MICYDDDDDRRGADSLVHLLFRDSLLAMYRLFGRGDLLGLHSFCRISLLFFLLRCLNSCALLQNMEFRFFSLLGGSFSWNNFGGFVWDHSLYVPNKVQNNKQLFIVLFGLRFYHLLFPFLPVTINSDESSSVLGLTQVQF